MDKEIMIPILAICGMAAFLVWGGNAFDRGQMQSACSRFAAESGYETKFVNYTYWSRDCLAKMDDGKWVSTYNLRGVVDLDGSD